MKKKRKRNPPGDSPTKDDGSEVTVNPEGNNQNTQKLSSTRLQQIREKLEKEEMPTQEELFYYCIWLTGENRKLSQKVEASEELFKETEKNFCTIKEEISNTTKTIQDLQENNNRLKNIEEEKNKTEKECENLLQASEKLGTENKQLKTEVVRAQAYRTRFSIRIKNLPCHQELKDDCESQIESEQQLKQLLSIMKCENLKYKSVQRLKFQTGPSTPKKNSSLKVTFLSLEDKKQFFRNLYLLKETNMNLEISQEFPKCLNEDLKVKNQMCYEIRKKDFKTRLVLRNYEIKIQIKLKDSKTWYTYDSCAPDIVYNIPVPKQQVSK